MYFIALETCLELVVCIKSAAVGWNVSTCTVRKILSRGYIYSVVFQIYLCCKLMFAVCSSWFEIDERKWTYYHHGSHHDWELGAKTTTVPTSKVLDSEWHHIVICKPSVTALSLLRFPIASVFLPPVCLFVCLFVRETTLHSCSKLLCYPGHGFAEHWPLNIKCAILKLLCTSCA